MRDDDAQRDTERGFETIRLADLETQAPTRVSWSELQVQRNEVRLPVSRRPARRDAPPPGR